MNDLIIVVFILLVILLVLGIIFTGLCLFMFFKHMDEWEIEEELEE